MADGKKCQMVGELGMQPMLQLDLSPAEKGVKEQGHIHDCH